MPNSIFTFIIYFLFRTENEKYAVIHKSQNPSVITVYQ